MYRGDRVLSEETSDKVECSLTVMEIGTHVMEATRFADASSFLLLYTTWTYSLSASFHLP